MRVWSLKSGDAENFADLLLTGATDVVWTGEVDCIDTDSEDCPNSIYDVVFLDSEGVLVVKKNNPA